MNLYSRAFAPASALAEDEGNAQDEDEEQAGPEAGETQSTEDTLSKRAKGYRQLNCNDCNRKFCLNYELPTCKGAKEEDVVTTCFREFRLSGGRRGMFYFEAAGSAV